MKILFDYSNKILSISIFLFLLITIVYSYFNFEKESPSDRKLATFENKKINLYDNWKYLTSANKSDTVESIFKKNLTWTPYDLKNNLKYADEIEGDYWLKKEFDVNIAIIHPAIVLGIISDSHKVYLNGYFIGGSDYFAYVAHYAFDQKILNYDKKNTLLIKAHTRKTTNPGIYSIHFIGSFLGEFSEVRSAALSDITKFHFSRLLYLASAFALCLVCFIYYLFHISDKIFLYFSLYLLLGCTALLYYNFFVADSLPHQYYRFIKLFSIVFSSFVLFSSYLYLIGKKRLTTFNNLFAILLLLVMSITLLPSNMSVSSYMNKYYNFFNLGFVYTLSWLTGVCSFTLFMIIRKGKNYFQKDFFFEHGYKIMVIISGALTGIMIYASSAKHIISIPIFDKIMPQLSYLGISYPFIFSLFLITFLTIKHIKNSIIVKYETERGQLTAEIAYLLNNSDDFESNITLVQEKVCQFVKAERSTIYLSQNRDGNSFFKADFLYGQRSKTKFVKRTIKPDKDIISIIYKSGEPLLVKDIETDPRTKDFFREKKTKNMHENESNYKTKSFMIFPLKFKEKIVGILTLSDKVEGAYFNDKDFFIASNTANALGILLNSAKMKKKLEDQMTGIIETLSNIIDQKDPYTSFHSSGVAYIAKRIATNYGIKFDRDMRIAALLHDVGKIFISKKILKKPTSLNQSEREQIEEHARFSEQILQQISGFEKIAKWAGQHHETIDGKGYPYNLPDNLISIEAQIIGIADFIDALCTNRAYRPRFTFEKVSEILESIADKKYSRKLINVAKEILLDDEFRSKYSERSYEFKPKENKEAAILNSYTEPLNELITNWSDLNTFLSSSPEHLDIYQISQSLAVFQNLNDILNRIVLNLQNFDYKQKVS